MLRIGRFGEGTWVSGRKERGANPHSTDQHASGRTKGEEEEER